MQKATSLGKMLGGLAGGAATWTFGLRSTLWLQLAVNLVMLAVALSLDTTTPRRSRVEHLGRITWSLRKRYRLVATIILTGTGGGLTIFFTSYLPLYASHVEVNGNSIPFGWYVGLWSIFMGAPWFFSKYVLHCYTRLCKGETVALAVATAIGFTLLIVAGLTISLIGVVAALGIFFMRSMQQPTLNTWTITLAGAEERATVASIGRFCMVGLAGVYTAVSSTAGNNPREAILLVGVLYLALSAIGLVIITLTSSFRPSSQDDATVPNDNRK